MAFFNVQVPNEVVDQFNSMKLKHTSQYMLFELTKDLKHLEVKKTVGKMVTDSEASSKAAYESFTSELEPNKCCFAVYDFHVDEGESGVRDKLIFLSWCPDDAPTKNKMIYTSCKEDIKKKLVGISQDIQATDQDELNYETIKEKVKKSK